ncbi:hypothetical protein GF1_02340 [Desulfolithobacter dissulfuricans]|uniref:HEPN domain-containing protein n=1 Tax=Desulfolithobacter dissulfuricans TaxID=2795293 RepID=A0A915XJH0_9BACT|nr:hypothetical protein [Desulfolithobacter dissulfuricans]BCO07858.1 hypothetical protein GF1_02340 [Desulfolithobacter dissulfuricans]
MTDTVRTPSPGANMIPLDGIRRQPIDDWEDFLKEGHQYLATARGGYARRRNIFTTEILYNLVAMAIEKFFMAALMFHGTLPYNHTMHDLVEAMDQTFPGAIDTMRERLLALDRHQEICDLDTYHIDPPSMAEIADMLVLAEQVSELVTGSLPGSSRTGTVRSTPGNRDNQQQRH